MPSSRRFKQLVNRLAVLRTHLLPRQFSPTGQYNDRDHDLARAYVVLVHAEIEAYCEDRGRKIARRAHQIWQRNGRHSAILMKLLKFHHVTTRKPWTPIDKSPDRIESAVNHYMSSIDQNHGIREENLSKILFPIGIEPSGLDNVWLTTMDSFGISRGTVAHTSVKTQQPIDPQTEFLRIKKQILPGLKKLDKKISRL
jgi:RiboL-PSP-HEPN